MEKVLSLLSSAGNDLLLYGILFVLAVCVFTFLVKNQTDTKSALNTLQVIKIVLSSKLGDKADGILDIWIEGLKMIQDGEFSNEDKVDQFVRYIRLGALSKGLELTDEDVEKIELLVLSTLEQFVSKKPSQIKTVVNKFNAMNHR